MAKILLVEDDKSLREIYGVRLLAEGYDIVSAGDGEEALAMAIKERPQLILSDVMMPKISGFDMLDILRSTTETKDIKVIMMTALSSEEQRARGVSLGADRYLVKSQVGIEDVVKTVHDVLSDTSPTAEKQPNADATITPAPDDQGDSTPSNTPLEPAPLATPSEPPTISTHSESIVSNGTQTPAGEVANPLVANDTAPTEESSTLSQATPETPTPSPVTPPAANGLGDRVIQPLAAGDTNNIADQLTKELEAKMPVGENSQQGPATPPQTPSN